MTRSKGIQGPVAKIALCLFALSGTVANAANLFITAGKPLEMKSDLGPDSKVLRTVEGGTEVELVRQMPRIGFSKIRLPSGESGWVVASRLSEQAPDPGQLLLAKQNMLGLSTPQLEKHIATTQTELNMVRQAAVTASRMQEERDQLLITTQQLQKTLDELRQEKSSLNADQKQLWFLMGAGMLLGGVILGLIIPRLRPKKRGVWG